MSCLLDTHAFLWAVFAPHKLSARARSVLVDPGQEVSLSTLSFWEISLKFGLGKLELKNCAPEDLVEVAMQMRLTFRSRGRGNDRRRHEHPRAIRYK